MVRATRGTRGGWHSEAALLHEHEHDMPGTLRTALQLYLNAAIDERDSYSGSGWTTWRPIFEVFGRTSQDDKVQLIARRALDQSDEYRS